MLPTFHVLISGETKGPYLLEQLRTMWDHGVLTADTLYWNDKKQEWHQLVEMLRGSKIEEAFPPPAEPTVSEPKKENLAPANHRLMARFLDLQIFGFLGYFLAEWIVRKFSLDAATFYFPFGFSFAVMGESLWLAIFKQTTPGKWFFGLHIEGDGDSFFTRRTWMVYWRCVPIFAPFVAILAFQDIAKTGTTIWDKKTHSRVCVMPVERLRIGCGAFLVALAVVASVFALLGYFGSLSGK